MAEKRDTKKGAKPKDEKVESHKLKILKPMLPGQLDRMLRRQDEDQHLDHIEVRFYPRGMNEIFFHIRDSEGNNTIRLTTGEYQRTRETFKPDVSTEKAEGAAAAFFKKLATRCYIQSSDLTDENARRVKAMQWPAMAKASYDLTQKDVKARKLTSTGLLEIWLSTSRENVLQMEAFQKAVDPNFTWEDTIRSVKSFVLKKQDDKKEEISLDIKKKKLEISKPTWADVEENKSTSVSFEDEEEEESDEEEPDPLEDTVEVLKTIAKGLDPKAKKKVTLVEKAIKTVFGSKESNNKNDDTPNEGEDQGS